MCRSAAAEPRAILQLIAVACARSPAAAREAAAHSHPAQILAVGLGCDQPEAIDAAMCLCADHELNASTFAARVAASTGAEAAVCICAALSALSGPRHGSLSEHVEALIEGGAVLGDGVPPGCGHRLYPGGDPRAAHLIGLRPVDPVVGALLDEIDERGLPAPSLDIGLVALRRALRLPRGSAMAIFAAGRTAGWLAHIAEEHTRGQLIRPRARYTGRRG
jgi:citrate synthase